MSAAAAPLQAQIAADKAQADQRQTALDAQRTQSATAENATLARMETAVNQKIGELGQMQPPPKADLPTYQPKPLVDPKEYQQVSMGLIGMALIAGIASKGNWMGVSSSLNGALKGYLEGNQERAKKEFEDYKTKYQEAKDKSEAQQKEFADTLQSKRLSINDMLTQIKITAAKYGRDDVRMEAEQKSIDGIWKRVESMDQAIYRSNEQNIRLQEAIAAKMALAKDKAAAGAGDFGGLKGDILAALAERGVSLPAGFRSKAQQQALLNGLVDRNPGKSADEIADLIQKGQIGFGAEKKETQTAAGIAGRVITGENELEEFKGPALAASNAVPRGSFVPFTEMQQKGEAALSDPNLKALYQWTNAVLNAYDVVAARGGTDKEKRAENRKNLETADSPETYAVALNVMMQEVAGAKRAAKRAEQGSDAPPAGAPKPFADPDKERRYQEWKRAHPDLQ